MDKPLTSKPKYLDHQLWLLVLVIVILLTLLLYFAFKKPKEFSINRNKIQIAQVVNEFFSEDIAIDGIIEPIRSITLDASESGTIEEIYHEEGDLVNKGESILKLSNSDLLLELMNRQEALAAEELRLESLKQEIANNKFQLINQLNDVQFQLARSKSRFSKDSFLFATNALAQVAYEESFNDFQYQIQKERLILQRINNEKNNEGNKLNKLLESIIIKRKNLEIVAKNLERLTIKANESGLITDLDVEVGEYRMKGSSIGKLDILEGFKAKASIDEHYLPKVFKGQKAEFSFNSEQYLLEIKSIYPQVNNGRFMADLRFISSMPKAITTGQSLQLKLRIGEPYKVLTLLRGPWNSSGEQDFVYVLNNDGKTAFRKKIVTGKKNTNSIEILEGLNEGDRIITSSYDKMNNVDQINITE